MPVEVSKPAFVTVVQRPDPNLASRRSTPDFGVSQVRVKQAVANDGIVDYVIEAVNRGEGGAFDTFVRMPFDAAEARVLDAKFSRPSAWVSRVISNTLEFHTGPLGANGDTVTGTIHLLTRPSAPLAASLGERLTYSWGDARGGGQGRSNLTTLVVAESDNNQPLYPLGISPAAGPAGTRHTFTSNIFAPGEPVSFWYNTGNTNTGVAVALADADGMVRLELTTTGLAAGNYSMVAYGNWTRFTAVGRFEVR